MICQYHLKRAFLAPSTKACIHNQHQSLGLSKRIGHIDKSEWFFIGYDDNQDRIESVVIRILEQVITGERYDIN